MDWRGSEKLRNSVLLRLAAKAKAHQIMLVDVQGLLQRAGRLQVNDQRMQWTVASLNRSLSMSTTLAKVLLFGAVGPLGYERSHVLLP